MAAKKARHHKTKNKSKTGGNRPTAKETAPGAGSGIGSNQEEIVFGSDGNDMTAGSPQIMGGMDDPFDEIVAKAMNFSYADSINFKGGNFALLKSIRNMVSTMEENKFLNYMEDIRTGKTGIEDIVELLDSFRIERNESPNVLSGNAHDTAPSTTNGNNDSNKGVRINELEPKRLEHEDHEKGEEEEEGEKGQDGDEEEEEQIEEGGYVSSNENESDNNSGEEYSFDLELSNNFFDPYKFHDALFKVLRITIPNAKGTTSGEQHRIKNLFSMLATLCDPYTQPSSTGDHNEMILSADLISDLVISLIYKEYVKLSDGQTMSLPAFDMAYDIAVIIEKIMIILNADDETNLIYINNDEEHWESELPKWLPHSALSNIVNIASDFHHMMLLYTIATAGLLIIQKLYRNMGNICLNPFLSMYLQIWKNQTRIIYLGIEIDRRDEDNGFPGYPEVIRYMIKGASAVRSMISLILNDDFDKRLHDLKHESLVNFMRPWGRKFTNGSITRDIRVFVAALLALGSELDSVTELLFNFDPEDRYDEDIKYMFEMELEDMEEENTTSISADGAAAELKDDTVSGAETSQGANEAHENEHYHDHHKENVRRYVGKNGILEIERHDEEVDEYGDGDDAMFTNQISTSSAYDLHPDCDCVFEDFESDFDEEGEYEEINGEDEAKVEENEERLKQVKQFDNVKLLNDFESLSHLSHIDLKDLDMETIQNLHLEAVRNINNGPSAVRATGSKNTEIDSKGRDWRDIPRGDNVMLTTTFVNLLKSSTDDSSIFLTPMENLLSSLQSMTSETLDSQTCEKIIRSIAWVVQYEHESKLMSDEEVKMNNDPNVNADVIYNFLKLDDNFVKMMTHNPSSAFFIIDELLMAEGYRRVLIWFLTHLPLNQWIINYFHDLLIGQRGNPSKEESDSSTRFSFSRQGPLVLSEVEQSMLLHEFLSNAVIYLSRGSSYELEDIMWNQIEKEKTGRHEKNDTTPTNNVSSFITNRSNAQKLIKVICLMLKSLEANKVIDPSNAEYRVEIQTLLVQWVGVGFVPEARELFFKYSSTGNVGKELSGDANGKTIVGKAEKENASSTKENILSKLSQSKFSKLMSYLENFSSFDLFIITLNMAQHYRTEKSTCFDFMKDLNSIAHVYETEEELLKSFDDFYLALNEALSTGDEERIIEIMYASKFLTSETNIIHARRAINIFIEGGELTNEAETNQTLQLLRQNQLTDHVENEKIQNALDNPSPPKPTTLLNSKKTKKKPKHGKHK